MEGDKLEVRLSEEVKVSGRDVMSVFQDESHGEEIFGFVLTGQTPV